MIGPLFELFLFSSYSKDVQGPLFELFCFLFLSYSKDVQGPSFELTRIRFSYFTKIILFCESLNLLITFRVHDDKLRFFVCDIFCGLGRGVLSVVGNSCQISCFEYFVGGRSAFCEFAPHCAPE